MYPNSVIVWSSSVAKLSKMQFDVLLPGDEFWEQQLSEASGIKPRVLATFSARGNCVASLEVINRAANFDLLRPELPADTSPEAKRQEVDRQVAIMLKEVYDKYGDDPKIPIPRKEISLICFLLRELIRYSKFTHLQFRKFTSCVLVQDELLLISSGKRLI